MSSQVWKEVYHAIRMVNRGVARTGRRPVYPDTLIVAMYLWAVWHDRPMCWAADRASYGSIFRPRRLPSRSQFGRRIRSLRCREILRRVFERLGELLPEPSSAVTLIDGRALRVQSHSTDPQAARGYASGGCGRGYKIHALAYENGRFLGFRVTSMNVAEKTVARELIDEHRPQGWLLGDAGYDSGPLYDYAAERGALLMAPLPKNAGGGHRPQSPTRMLVQRLWKCGGKLIHRGRIAIERFFGQLSAFGGGLSPLPAWVRRLERVERWVTAKFILYHARLLVKSTRK